MSNMNVLSRLILLGVTIISFSIIGCNDDDPVAPMAKDINAATRASIDRFSMTAGHLMVRTSTNGLPDANAPIQFDNSPFITTGLDRTGAPVVYYNFDIQSTVPSPIYVFFKVGESSPLNGQNNVVATIPGDLDYNDFWLVTRVDVPGSYVPNSLTSESEILASGYSVMATTTIVNCPIVPFGSTALRSKTANTVSTLTSGWYNGQAVAYFNFDEALISTTAGNQVPVSPIYVMFNNNSEGPASGFITEPGNSVQTHNVLATSPGDAGYSPLWSVRVIDNSHFTSVMDLMTAVNVMSMPAGVNVNCPVVK